MKARHEVSADHLLGRIEPTFETMAEKHGWSKEERLDVIRLIGEAIKFSIDESFDIAKTILGNEHGPTLKDIQSLEEGL